MNKMQRFTDKYFLRSNEILQKSNLNPWVNMQVFVRKGPGIIKGIDEAIGVILDNSSIIDHGGKIYALNDGEQYNPNEVVMNIIAPIQDIMELETIYLGILTHATTKYNDKKDIDFDNIAENIREVVDLAGDRPVMYFGARHWHWTYDSILAEIAFNSGCSAVATDNGSGTRGLVASGTIPHALENIFAYYYGRENAVVKSLEAFDKHISNTVNRIALVDYNNKEIADSLACAKSLGGRLYGIRFDTCGENLSEGASPNVLRDHWDGKQYDVGTGVVTSGIVAARKAMNEAGHENIKFILSSGFSNPKKVEAFNRKEKEVGFKLYDSIGAGFLDGVRTFTADIVAVGERYEEVDFFLENGPMVADRNIVHKVGRGPRVNERLIRVV